MRSLVIPTFRRIYTASPLFCNPAPLLQQLGIYGHSYVSSGGVVHLPENFLGKRVPSLRSVKLYCICPTLESPFPLPNLTEFYISLDSTTPFRVGALFLFFSESPLLQKVDVTAYGRSVQDVSLDKVISLESLVELSCYCNCASQIIPFLRLPRLKRLRVASLEPIQAQTLANILPHGGRALLARVTKLRYDSNQQTPSRSIELTGDEVYVSLYALPATADATVVDWPPDQTYIPFGQVEDLKFGQDPPTGRPIDVFAFDNLRILRVVPWDGEFTGEHLRSLHPDTGAAKIPCRSFQEIEVDYAYSEFRAPLPELLVSLVRERKQAGCQLRLVSLVVEYDRSRRDFMEELKEHVREVRVRAWGSGV